MTRVLLFIKPGKDPINDTVPIPPEDITAYGIDYINAQSWPGYDAEGLRGLIYPPAS